MMVLNNFSSEQMDAFLGVFPERSDSFGFVKSHAHPL